MNNKLRKSKMDFRKEFFRLMINVIFGKTTANIRKHRDIELVITSEERSFLVSESNYHTTKWFSEGLLATEMKKIKVKINKAVY